MSTPKGFIDPALLIWDISDFNADQGRYWLIAGEVIELFDRLDESDIELALCDDILATMLASFPANELDHANRELRDFSIAVYGFLSREPKITYQKAGTASSVPDLVNRAHFSNDLKNETGHALYFVLQNAPNFAIFSHEEIIGPPHCASVTLNAGGLQASVEYFGKSDKYAEFVTRIKPVYERSWKHDPLSGFGSRLPSCLTNDDLQTLLEDAIDSIGVKCLCVFSTKATAYIVFRRHHANRYHAYPVEENELSRMGLNPADIHRA